MAAAWSALGFLVLGLGLLWFLICPNPRLDFYFGRFWADTYIWRYAFNAGGPAYGRVSRYLLVTFYGIKVNSTPPAYGGISTT